jgi:hypothetical protein
LLARERGLTFTEVVEEWLAWRPGQPASLPDQEAMSAFVTYLCGRRHIPPEFYQQFGAFA